MADRLGSYYYSGTSLGGYPGLGNSYLHTVVSLGEVPKTAAHTNNTLDLPVILTTSLIRPLIFGLQVTAIDRFHCTSKNPATILGTEP